MLFESMKLFYFKQRKNKQRRFTTHHFELLTGFFHILIQK